ncbi:ATP-binding protein [Sphaerisporangium siamense]|uniref:Tetratricopeptide (TPR) repeat protein n=1 Tax=Sphaerisporangium siamense TaxID=795645 RepID=A0A7W7D4P1_9ACTN|nr:tetratricopeptide repeat protein [Sphaerisporangium siamense]MBB4700183.1 tetratricopeptide (TPR) repeat protein [Sphaerisporangium siamense]
MYRDQEIAMVRGSRTDPGLEMASLLRALRDQAGISVREMERRSRDRRGRNGRAAPGLSKTTVSALIHQEKPTWPTREQFDAFVDTCLTHARAHGRDLPTYLGDAAGLGRRYAELSTRRARQVGRPPAAASPATVPRQLPPAIGGFVGRSREMAELTALLSPEDARPSSVVIAAVSGSPGVGKTALALHWAHLVRDAFPDGSLYVNLRGGDRDALAPEDVLEGFLRALNVAKDGIPPLLDDRARLYRSLLDKRRTLVVLDNAASVHQVRPLLPASPGSMAIVTSRTRLTGLIVQEGAHPLPVDLLSAAEAHELLRQIVGTERTAAEPEAVAEIARMCACLPLALRIAAERIAIHPHDGLADLAAELAVEQERLGVLETEDVSVRTAFALSYQDLPEEAARLFRLLALHPGPDISTQAAEALAGLGPAETRRRLDRLTQAHLLEETGKGRYRFHDLLRCYAREVLAEERERAADADGEHRRAEDRLIAWYAHSAAAVSRMLAPSPAAYQPALAPPPAGCRPERFDDHAGALRWCDAERANLVAATRRAAERGGHEAWQIPVTLMFACYLGAYVVADWMALLEPALPAVRRAGEPNGEGVILFSLGLVHWQAHRFDESVACFQKAAGLWRATGYRWGEGSALHKLAETYALQQRFEEAERLFRRVLATAEELGEQWGRGNVLVGLGNLCKSTGRTDEAIAYLNEALTTYRDTRPDLVGNGAALIGLGDVHQSLGRHDRAIDYYRLALTSSHAGGSRDNEVRTLFRLGESLFHDGQAEEAYRVLSEAMAIFDELGDPRADSARDLIQKIQAGDGPPPAGGGP